MKFYKAKHRRQPRFGEVVNASPREPTHRGGGVPHAPAPGTSAGRPERPPAYRSDAPVKDTPQAE